MSDKNSLFMQAQWHEDLDLVLHLSCYTSQLLVVTGPKQVGKTTFAQSIEENIKKHFTVYSFQAKEARDLNVFLNLLIETFDFPSKANPTHLRTSEYYDALLMFIQRQEKEYLIMLDDADQLPKSVLEMIAYLMESQLHKAVKLRFILVGQHLLVEKLQAIVKTKKFTLPIHVLRISPLNYKDTIRFIQMNFGKIAKQMGLNFSRRTFKMIFEMSQGCPGRIQEITQNWLKKELKEKHHRLHQARIQRRKQFQTVGVAVFSSVVLASAYLMSMSMTSSHSKSNNKHSQPLQAKAQIQLPAKQIAKNEVVFTREQVVKVMASLEFASSLVSSVMQREKVATAMNAPAVQPAPAHNAAKPNNADKPIMISSSPLVLRTPREISGKNAATAKVSFYSEKLNAISTTSQKVFVLPFQRVSQS